MRTPHLCIQPVLFQQLLVDTTGADIAILHHKYPVAVGDGGEPVGNDQQGLSFCQLGYGGLNEGFIFRIGKSCCLCLLYTSDAADEL